jgi:hypothetical protein
MSEEIMSYGHTRQPRQVRHLTFVDLLKHRFRHFTLRYVAPISRHPAMTLVTGFGLFISGCVEIAEQIFTDFDTLIGVHQAVILLGIVTFLRGMADLVEASEWLSKGSEEREAAALAEANTKTAPAGTDEDSGISQAALRKFRMSA